MQKIIPHLWFSTNAEEAVAFYTSIFEGGKTCSTTRYTKAGYDVHHMEEGTVMTMEFEIEGFRMIALNGGPVFTFTPAISFMVRCPKKEDVDALWRMLLEGGEALMPLDAYPFNERYGWVKDRYGVSWQLIYTPQESSRSIVPAFLFVGDQYGKAEEAIREYVATFPDSLVGTIVRYEGGEAGTPGTVMYADFTLANQPFAAMDGPGTHNFTFNEAVSLLVTCADQAEIDRYWERLSAVPEAEMCGWLKDRFGVSWQIVPEGMETLLNNPDTEKAERAMQAVLSMKKLDIALIHKATE